MNTTNTFEDKYNEEDAKLDGTSSKVKEILWEDAPRQNQGMNTIY